MTLTNFLINVSYENGIFCSWILNTLISFKISSKLIVISSITILSEFLKQSGYWILFFLFKNLWTILFRSLKFSQLLENLDNRFSSSNDGLFKYSVENDLLQKILSPFETDVFSEGWRYAPVTKEKWVFINMTDSRNLKYKITYLVLES